jgi:MoaA/NifB/PqqE/SkfB family radical SAM enzyme
MSQSIRNVKYNPLTNEFRATADELIPMLPQVMWHITDRCPLSCPYCFATKTGQDSAIERAHEVLDVLGLLGVQKIDIAGGEPLAFPYLSQLVEEAVQAGFALTITTSGAGLDENREWLVSNAKLFSRVIVSVDGSTKELHDELRGRVGTFEQVANLLFRIRQTNACPIRLNTVVVRSTLAAPKCLAELVSNLQPAEWCLIQPHPANKKQNFDSHSITLSQFESFVTQMRMILDQENLPVGRLISRTASDYSGYWVLYPDGMLRRHTDGPEDKPEFPLTKETVNSIRMAIVEHGVTVPLEA